MFQSFEAPAERTDASDRIARLRRLLENLHVDAVLVPRADEHQGEYVPACAERLTWLTGFSGSAGLAIVTLRDFGLFVDGRYTVQARKQVRNDNVEILQIPAAKPTDWLQQKLKPGAVIGFDPRLHTVAEVERLTEALSTAQIKLKALTRNPVDQVWGADRPPAPQGPVRAHPLRYAGIAAED